MSWRRGLRLLKVRINRFRALEGKARITSLDGRLTTCEVEIGEQAGSSYKSFEDFCRRVCGFVPFKYQLDLAKSFEENQFTVARWCRQSGKSFIVSALLLKYAYEHDKSSLQLWGRVGGRPSLISEGSASSVVNFRHLTRTF